MLTLLAVLCASVSHGLGWPGVFMVTTSDSSSPISNRIQVREVGGQTDGPRGCRLSAGVLSQGVISPVTERSALRTGTTR